MDTPNFSPKQYISSASMNAAFDTLSQSVVNAINDVLFGGGIIDKNSLTFTQSGLNITATFGSGFMAIFPSGLSQAHGTTPNTDTQVYNISVAPYVPGGGSQTVYLYLTYFPLPMSPQLIVGPPNGHPDYNPDFAPYQAYGYTRDSFSLSAGTSVPAGSLEIARMTLSAGQTTPPVLNTSYTVQGDAFRILGLGDNGGVYYSSNTVLTAQNFGQIVFYTGAANGTFTLPASDSIGPFLGKIIISNVSGYTLSVVTAAPDVGSDLNPSILQPGQTLAVANGGNNFWRQLWNEAGSPTPVQVGNAVSSQQAVALGQLNGIISGLISSEVPGIISAQVPGIISAQVPGIIDSLVPGLISDEFNFSLNLSGSNPYQTGYYEGPPAAGSGLKLVIQTGYWTMIGTGGIFSFPEAFPNGFLSMVVADQNGGAFNVIGRPVVFAGNAGGSGGYISNSAIAVTCCYWNGSAFVGVPSGEVASCAFIALGWSY